MQASYSKQRGLTFISIVILLSLIGFFTLLTIKIAPLYINNSRVANAVAALKETTDLTSKSKEEIKRSLEKRFDMNYVDYVKINDVEVIAQPGYVKVNIEYERVEKIFGNLSVLVQFHEGFEVGSR